MITKPNTTASWLLCFGYILLLAYFNFFDVYHQHFFAKHVTVICYHFARLAFIFYFLWIMYAIGQYILTKLAFDSYKRTTSVGAFIQAFLTGAGITSLTLFFVGLIGFYDRWLLDLVTVMILFMSRNHLQTCLDSMRLDHQFYWPGCLLLALPVLLLLIIKGLYPAGGHDYYNHYFQFYRLVADSGSILPNDVWYHFYYSKGAGLFYLSILTTDLLGPQLISMAMLMVGAVMVFSILKFKSKWGIFPWIGAALYLTLMIYTPGPHNNLMNGGWGDLEKLHEPVAVLMLSIIWLAIYMARAKTSLQASAVTLAFVVISIVLMTPVMAAISAIYLMIISIFFHFTKKTTASKYFFMAAMLAGSTLVGLWIINYIITGLPDDQNLFIFWPIVNFNKIMAWGVLWELLNVHWDKTQLAVNHMPLSSNYLYTIATYLRLDVWWPLFSGAIVLYLLACMHKRTRNNLFENIDKRSVFACGAFLLLIAVLSLFLGREQPISFYRFSTFSYAPMLCFCMLLVSPFMGRWSVRILVSTLVLSITWFDATNLVSQSAFGTNMLAEYHRGDAKLQLKNALKFSMGKYSIADAYHNQQGWPGRMPWGAIYPGAQTVWSTLPPKTRVWSMHVHSYCMLPDCYFETYMSYRLSHNAEIVYYGNPNEAKKSLQNENLNYFFIAKSLQLTDPLPLSPLFSPKQIANYLGIVWTDGDNTLLTWKDQARYPIDSAWLTSYKKIIDDSVFLQQFPYDKFKIVMTGIERDHQFKQSDIPWVINSHKKS